jgi:hypothetical protein
MTRRGLALLVAFRYPSRRQWKSPQCLHGKLYPRGVSSRIFEGVEPSRQQPTIDAASGRTILSMVVLKSKYPSIVDSFKNLI